MPIPCEQKDTILEINRELKDLAMKIAAQEMAGEIGHEQISSIFNSLKSIQTYVDQNIISANHRDKKLDEIISMMGDTRKNLDIVDKESIEYRSRIEKKVEKIQLTVDNGLNKRVTEVTTATEENTKALQQIRLCLEERKRRGLEKQEQLEGKSGLSKFWILISYSFDDFVRRHAAMAIVTFIMGIFFFVLWFVTKSGVFGEKPVKGLFQILFGG